MKHSAHLNNYCENDNDNDNDIMRGVQGILDVWNSGLCIDGRVEKSPMIGQRTLCWPA
jgi:hypothetical protein